MTTANSPAANRPRETLTHLYDAMRDARMNVLYYGRRLVLCQRWNLSIEIAIALGTSGTLLSLPFFTATGGKTLAISLGAIAAMLGVCKPLLNLPSHVERFSKLWSAYQSAFVAAQRLARRIKSGGAVSQADAEEIESLHDRIDSICADDDPCPDKDRLAAFWSAVNAEIPADRLWYPAAC